jgi:hypothetical protein
MREYVKEPYSGRVLGFYERSGPSNRVECRDAAGKLLAYYDVNADRTHEANGRIVGAGNLLPSFLVHR